jgi:hypothetical protein
MILLQDETPDTGDILGGTLQFPFGEAEYYNTDDEDMVYRVVIKAARINEVRNYGAKEQVNESYVNVGSRYKPKVVNPDQKNTKVGLFYFSKDYKKVFVSAFPAGTPNSEFGLHMDFFKKLVKDGTLSGEDYEAYPRGFTFYDLEKEVYMIVGGEWLNQKRGENVCDKFGYPRRPYPWSILKTRTYTYGNMGKNAGKRLPL